ncbi:hypothetical protein OAU50_02205 [Planctomycetota bacterium]|nr:hypothetical protein [Planctomycetota bacterium]
MPKKKSSGTRKPPAKKKASKKPAKKSGRRRKKSGGKMNVGKAAVKAVKTMTVIGGVVVASVATKSAIDSRTSKPLHPIAKAGITIGTALAAAFAATKLKMTKPFAPLIVTAGTVAAGVDALPAFEDAGNKVAAKLPAPKAKAGTEAAQGIRRTGIGNRGSRMLSRN